MAKIAVIGTGIAGMGCGHFLHKRHDIYFFEKNGYIGGHTNTVDVEEDGNLLPIDTGFIVYNEVTYPNLVRLFKTLKVETKDSSMSFSVQHLPTDLEFCGSGIRGLFSQKKNFFNLGFLKLLYQINRFNDEAPRILNNPKYKSYTMRQYIEEFKYGTDILYRYLIPMSSAVWSTEEDLMLEFPATTLIRFFFNHGFLGLHTQHQWKTVSNGSRSYVKILTAPFADKIQLKNGVKKVIRDREKKSVKVISEDGSAKEFDRVIFACHGDTALSLIENPTEDEKNYLSQFKYQKNIATLHTDSSIMPKISQAWSSWNYRVEKDGSSSTIYWMNSLQGISKKVNYFLSINDPGRVSKDKILKVIEYEHPVFNVAATDAQQNLQTLNKDPYLNFCGSYFKYGFHEDALTSAVDVCSQILGKSAWS